MDRKHLLILATKVVRSNNICVVGEATANNPERRWHLFPLTLGIVCATLDKTPQIQVRVHVPRTCPYRHAWAFKLECRQLNIALPTWVTLACPNKHVHDDWPWPRWVSRLVGFSKRVVDVRVISGGWLITHREHSPVKLGYGRKRYLW